MQLLDEMGPVCADGALIDRALVGYIPLVDIGESLEQNCACDMVRAAGSSAGKLAQRRFEMCPHPGLGDDFVSTGAGRQPCMPAARFKIGKDHGPDVVAVETSHDHIANKGSASGDDTTAHGRKIDPGAGGEFEILGHAPVKDEPLIEPFGVSKPYGVTDTVVPLIVEGFGGLFRVS